RDDVRLRSQPGIDEELLEREARLCHPLGRVRRLDRGHEVPAGGEPLGPLRELRALESLLPLEGSDGARDQRFGIAALTRGRLAIGIGVGRGLDAVRGALARTSANAIGSVLAAVRTRN